MLSSYDLTSLNSYFSNLPAPGSWFPWIPGLDSVVQDVTVEYQGVKAKVGGFKGWYQSITATERFAFATWKWLRPAEPTLSLKELSGLQKAAGLDHLTFQEFLLELRSRCREFQRNHSTMSKWVRKRIALMDYAIDGVPTYPRELVEAQSGLLFQYTQANHLIWQDPEEAQNATDNLIRDLLLTAAGAALSAFSNEYRGWNCSANIMLPFNAENLPQVGRFLNAQTVWGVPEGRCLSVVTDTSSENIGFWVPLRKTGGYSTPGAAMAFNHLEGSAVFKDDLPPLPGLSTAVVSAWTTYMQNIFEDTMFVSIPLSVIDGHGNSPIAVLNINVSPPPNSEEIWRACQPEYLKEAQARAATYLTQLILTYQLGQRARGIRGQDILLLESAAEEWNDVPGLPRFEVVENDTE